MANETMSELTRAARTLTPDAEHTASALKTQPQFVALRLQFSYEIPHETTPRQQPYMTETLGLLFPAEVKEEQQIQAIETALRAGGAILPSGGLAKMWSAIDVGSRRCAKAVAPIGSEGNCSWTVDSTESAMKVFAKKTRSIGAHIAEISEVVRWGRVDDVQGAKSVMHGLNLLFEEFEALNDARTLGASIAKPAASVKPRPL